jgi:hypothetical protein
VLIGSIASNRKVSGKKAVRLVDIIHERDAVPSAERASTHLPTRWLQDVRGESLRVNRALARAAISHIRGGVLVLTDGVKQNVRTRDTGRQSRTPAFNKPLNDFCFSCSCNSPAIDCNHTEFCFNFVLTQVSEYRATESRAPPTGTMTMTASGTSARKSNCSFIPAPTMQEPGTTLCTQLGRNWRLHRQQQLFAYFSGVGGNGTMRTSSSNRGHRRSA